MRYVSLIVWVFVYLFFLIKLDIEFISFEGACLFMLYYIGVKVHWPDK